MAADARPASRHTGARRRRNERMLGVRTTSRCVPGPLRQSRRVVGRERRNARRVKTATATTTAGADAIRRGDESGTPLAVCLGKFDAMHKGHYALAEHAAKLGYPVMLSFSGMAETLGWEERLPITAAWDRERVLGLWAKEIGGEDASPLRQHTVPFKEVRELSPEAFVEMLAGMGVNAVVTGENYRFGYKAAGDVEALKTFGAANGMQVDVVDLVPADRPSAMGLGDQVSSTRVRRALMDGNINEANSMLGREHRLIFNMTGERMANALKAALASDVEAINISLEAAENQPPSDGQYSARVLVDPLPNQSSENVKTVTVTVSYGRLSIDRYEVPDIVFARERLAVDFCERVSARYANNVSGRW